ncbi:hypothetical protein PhCBS80983_g03159 [Powellomyces hirtus]|uniref:Rab3 GTPase-activating protein catalytic subunit n=1 Tax=Powellomyces hirtus TaxID=109895 RepID=A0A507E2P3_9FUNG|nr:hypothetical protein PhCBS80983_g03159 [Powellomyces hirtus]
MADEAEDDGFFEIVDFTSASPLERFITSIECQLTEWDFGAGVSEHTADLAREPAHLRFSETDYTLSYHTLAEDDDSAIYQGYPPVAQATHMLHRWTGLQHYLTLVPRNQPQRGGASLDINTTKLLLSSFLVAAGNTGCTIGAFVPTGPGWKSMWAGARIDADGGETRWRMVHAPYVPPQWSELEGLWRLVATKMDHHNSRLRLDIDVSIALSYVLPVDEEDIEWREHSSNPPPDGSDASLFDAASQNSGGDKQGLRYGTEVITLPYGPAANPIKTVTLEALLPRESLDTYSEHVDFLEAPIWRLVFEVKEDFGDCIFSSMLERIIDAWVETCPGASLGDGSAGDAPTDFGTAQRKDTGGMVDATDISDALQALLQSPSEPPPPTIPPPDGQSYPSSSSPPESHPTLKSIASQYRSPCFLPLHSLLDNLILRILDWNSPEAAIRFREASLYHTLGALWTELVGELRVCWETGMLVPGVWTGEGENEDIELRWNLLYQKLQMLNYCIRRRRETGEYDIVTEVEGASGPELPTQGAPPVHETSMLSLSQRALSRIVDLPTKADSALNAGISSLLSLGGGIGSADRRPPVPKDSPLRVGTGPGAAGSGASGPKSPYDRPPLEATSWSSDRSWEDILKARRSSNNGMVVGSLGNRSIGSFEDAGAPHHMLDVPDAHHHRDANGTRRPSSHEEEDIFFDTMEGFAGDPSHSNLDPPAKSVSATSTSTPISPPPGPARNLTDSFIQVPLPSPPATTSTIPVISPILSRATISTSTTPTTERVGHKTLLPFTSFTSGQQLYIPHTQSAGPQTEDQIVEFEQRLTDLPPTERARLQSKSLASDMMAFKAANPATTMEDFVRWYSPRDWIEEDENTTEPKNKNASAAPSSGEEDQHDTTSAAARVPLINAAQPPAITTTNKGTLSGRMSEPGNLWVQIWNSSPPLPATRQTPLFDHTQTALAVLIYLENLSLHDLLTLLIPQALLHAYKTVTAAHHLVPHIPILQHRITHLAATIAAVRDETPLMPRQRSTTNTGLANNNSRRTGGGVLPSAIHALAAVETCLGVATALTHLLGGTSTTTQVNWELVNHILDASFESGNNREGTTGIVPPHPVTVVTLEMDEEARNDVVRMFRKEGTLSFPPPASREYIFTHRNSSSMNRPTATYPHQQHMTSSLALSLPSSLTTTAASTPQPTYHNINNNQAPLPSGSPSPGVTRVYAILRGGEFRVVETGYAA